MNDAKKAIDRMAASYRAHFVPAAGALGLIFAAGYGVAKHPKEAETLFLRGIKSGHIPSTLMLCRFYTRGERGFVKTILGNVLFSLAWLYVWISARFMIFSIRQFQHFHLSALPMFNEKALKP